MTGNEFSSQFDVLYNNITSNQAPGLNEYEKSVFLTKAQNELLKNYFLPQSNAKQAGFDGNSKRQMDFSSLMQSKGHSLDSQTFNDAGPSVGIDPRGKIITLDSTIFIPINENLCFYKKTNGGSTYTVVFQRQVIPLAYDEYTRLMNKPYKEPLKGQAWRLLVSSVSDAANTNKKAEIIINHNDLKWLDVPESGYTKNVEYVVRYIRKPKPILVAPIDSYGMSIDGHDGGADDTDSTDGLYELEDDGVSIKNPCELDSMLHEEILQRAVELAKVAWTANGQENVQLVMQAGQRSE